MKDLLKYANSSIPRTKEEKLLMIEEAAKHYGAYMTALGMDWKNDPNSSDTPMRVSKAFVNDFMLWYRYQSCFKKHYYNGA